MLCLDDIEYFYETFVQLTQFLQLTTEAFARVGCLSTLIG